MPPAKDHRARTVFNTPGLIVTGASAEHMMAMKIDAARNSDEDDIPNWLSAVARKSVILDGTSTTTCRGCMSEHRRQEPVWTSVRGADVKAVSPAERGRSEATRLDVVLTGEGEEPLQVIAEVVDVLGAGT